jgi:hypothetical protein
MDACELLHNNFKLAVKKISSKLEKMMHECHQRKGKH